MDYSTAEGDAYHQARHKEFLASPLLADAWANFIRLTYFSDLPIGASVLEVGAGLGTNLLGIKNIAEVTAVEPAEMARKHCASLGIQTVESLVELPLSSQFDFVLLRHVLEHLQEPRQMLEEVRPFLKKDGILIIALPVESQTARPNPADIDHHLYSWTRQSICNLLAENGYSVVESKLNYRNGRRLLLPVYSAFGAGAYTLGLKILGRARGLCEIIVRARKK